MKGREGWPDRGWRQIESRARRDCPPGTLGLAENHDAIPDRMDIIDITAWQMCIVYPWLWPRIFPGLTYREDIYE